MSEQKESSVLFSLKELMNLEEDRIKQEEETKRAQAEAAERSRLDAERRAEAKRCAAVFCRERLPKYLQWFEAIVVRNPAGSRHLVGGKLSYADLSLFQLIEGLRYAFPAAAARALARTPGIVALHDRVAGLPKLAAYLRSERRIPFNEQGIFRRYPELDLP